ncbi:MAG: PH domain-containing protein [Zoogloeaceae bacterium]|jgi:uncharacterized membrane protein YdbT with pleckstrin-like domain|nr:PH domain-containing protein [Zoogloeaceae bacterium]
MGQYVQNSLISGEVVEAEATISWMSQFWYFLFSAVTIPFVVEAAAIIVIPIILIAIAAINVLTTELAATNKKVIGKAGFIRRVSVDMPLAKLESITLDQGVIGRIFNFGTVVVRGVGGNRVGIPYIKSPLDFRRMVMNLMDARESAQKSSASI